MSIWCSVNVEILYQWKDCFYRHTHKEKAPSVRQIRASTENYGFTELFAWCLKSNWPAFAHTQAGLAMHKAYVVMRRSNIGNLFLIIYDVV